MDTAGTCEAPVADATFPCVFATQELIAAKWGASLTDTELGSASSSTHSQVAHGCLEMTVACKITMGVSCAMRMRLIPLPSLKAVLWSDSPA